MPLKFIIDNVEELVKRGLRMDGPLHLFLVFEKLNEAIGEKKAEESFAKFLLNCKKIEYQEEGGQYRPTQKTLSFPKKDSDIKAYPFNVLAHEICHAIRIADTTYVESFEEAIATIFETVITFKCPDVTKSAMLNTIPVDGFRIVKGYWLDVRKVDYVIVSQLFYCILLIAGHSIAEINQYALDSGFQPICLLKESFYENADEIISDFSEAFNYLRLLYGPTRDNGLEAYVQGSTHYINCVLMKSLLAIARKGGIKYKEQIEVLLPLEDSILLPQFMELLNLRFHE